MLGKRLAHEKFNLVISSDLKRTVDTSGIIMSFMESKPDFKTDERLREKSAGVYEGQPLGTTGDTALKLGINPREFRPENGESWLDINKRVVSFISDLQPLYREMMGSTDAVSEEEKHLEVQPKKILLITHGGWITEFLNVAYEMMGGKHSQKEKVKNCALFVFKLIVTDEGCVRFDPVVENDVSHMTD